MKDLFSEDVRTDVRSIKWRSEYCHKGVGYQGQMLIYLPDLFQAVLRVIERVAENPEEKIELERKYLSKLAFVIELKVCSGELIDRVFSDIKHFLSVVDVAEKHKNVSLWDSIEGCIIKKEFENWRKCFHLLYNLNISKEAKEELSSTFKIFREAEAERKNLNRAKENYRKFCKELKPFVIYKNVVREKELSKYLTTQHQITKILTEEVSEAKVATKMRVLDAVKRGFDTVKKLEKELNLSAKTVGENLNTLHSEGRLDKRKVKNMNIWVVKD